MLVIFKKDLRRLWWGVGISVALLAELARQDRWRSDALPGSIEGWLNVIVPFVWACLLGLVVEQDPLVGDRQFWITRPHRRASLLGAKLLFAAVFIHGASFLADCYILSARGFSPFSWLPQLLWKQTVLAAALTLPSLAVAALFRNFTQFMLAVLCALAVIVIATGSYDFRLYSRLQVDVERTALVVLVVCAAAVGIIVLQFLRRKTLGSRAIGAAAACTAVAAYLWLPESSLWAARSHDAVFITVGHARGLPLPFSWMRQAPNRETILLPLTISGVPAGQRYRIEQLELELDGVGGERYRSYPRVQTFSAVEIPFTSYFMSSGEDSNVRWLLVQMSAQFFRRLARGQVTIRGEEGVTLSRVGPSATAPLLGNSAPFGKFRCTGTQREDQWDQLRVKFECESPQPIPPYTQTDLTLPSRPLQWRQFLGDVTRFVPYVHQTWLSPLDRRQTSFNLTYPSRGFVPPPEPPTAEELAHAQVIVTPEFVTGHSLVKFELKDVRLEDYLLPQK